MKTILMKILIVFLAVVFTVLGFYQITMPTYSEMQIKNADFSLEKANEMLKVIAMEPHPSGSEQNEKVREYLVNYLRSLGMQVEVQKEAGISEGMEYHLGNIIAKTSNTSKDGLNILLSAHYDSVATGPGAADDGAGVAALLEAARKISNSKSIKNNIYILLTDGEELDLLGAKSFVKQNKSLSNNIDFVANFEARGNRGPLVMFETSDNNLGILNAYKKFFDFPLGFSFSQDIYKNMPNDTDFTVFKKEGISGMNFAVLDGFDTYHTKNDNVRNLNRQTLMEYGNTAISVVDYFGNISKKEFLNVKQEKSNAIYFPLLKGNLVVYSEELVMPLMVFTLIFFLAILLWGIRKKILDLLEMLKGALIGFGVIIGLTVLSILAVLMIIQLHHLKVKGINVQFFSYENNYAMSILAVVLLLICLIYQFFSKKLILMNLAAGGLCVWTLLMVIGSIFLRGASYIFIVPLIFTMIAFAYYLLRGSARITIAEKTIISAFVMIFTCLIIVPIIYMVYIAMGLGIVWILVFLTLVPLIAQFPFYLQLTRD